MNDFFKAVKALFFLLLILLLHSTSWAGSLSEVSRSKQVITEHVILQSVSNGSEVDPGAAGSGQINPGGDQDQASALNSAAWWQREWIFVLFLLILSGGLYALRMYELSRVALKNQIRIANMETSKLKELDRMKSQFFANISHEFRTPLTLIKGPLEHFLEEDNDAEKQKSYQLMHSNTDRLLQLINQLLDLSRIESGNYLFKAGKGDIVAFIEGLVMSFASLADQKNISLGIEKIPDSDREWLRHNFYYDRDSMEKILNNLLSNAFKFTPAGGRIGVKQHLVTVHGKKRFEIQIEDRGVGIPADKLPFIFDRFYKVDELENPDMNGSGIGLAYVSELAKMLACDIDVNSTVGEGTTFRLSFPSGTDHLSEDQQLPSGTEYLSKDQLAPLGTGDLSKDQVVHFGTDDFSQVHSPHTDTMHAIYDEDLVMPGTGYMGDGEPIRTEQEGSSDETGLPWILIVEDHKEVREYISESIRSNYRVLMAANASDGFALAEEQIPDLIISDVMMPEMDGFRFCEKIKTSEKTSHIPLILLTARAEIGDRITGLETGADDYIIKPFNTRELHTRIRNLIEGRRILRQKFSVHTLISPGEISVTSRDASFMEKLLKHVEENMDNPGFTVEDLGREAGMSQSQLHRKLKAVANMSALQFIRSIRMQRAMELLQKGAGNISEIAYMVGYDDPGYFSKSFRKFFDKLPSEIGQK